jgi:hypothetical protein
MVFSVPVNDFYCGELRSLHSIVFFENKTNTGKLGKTWQVMAGDVKTCKFFEKSNFTESSLSGMSAEIKSE